MTNQQAQTMKLAEVVDSAASSAQAIPQLSHDYPQLNVAQAYQIQTASLEHRLARGEKLVGIKMGFTSRAKMVQMGVDDLIWGRLTDKMQLVEGGTTSMSRFIHPRIEPEIAFRLKKNIKGYINLSQAMEAVDGIAPAMEIIDSRYTNFNFSLPDVIADNSSSSGFVLGQWHSPNVDISNQAMIMEFNGRAVQIGSSSAILGNPYRSLVEAARLAAESGLCLEAGHTVLAGAATAAHPLAAGDHVCLHTGTLGKVEITLEADND
ncbi:4-oxalocrotonate decarboxylase [Saliniradius amylolyticus]|uniref:4-oxalocrotonate decarboxylase n=1 Tax=Saliniradius amylolyticus TaxID=2183582 RepID=A0A2S2E6B4_9ALTE|nr:fumarylacetoacetate hydrolase family protein [Saliniradius amylolyticus]AWL13188.1 4-oxalocrotonate decarboxylase [Saliniradius amylolyticus]